MFFFGVFCKVAPLITLIEIMEVIVGTRGVPSWAVQGHPSLLCVWVPTAVCTCIERALADVVQHRMQAGQTLLCKGGSRVGVRVSVRIGIDSFGQDISGMNICSPKVH